MMNITLQGFSAWANGLTHFFLISFNFFYSQLNKYYFT